MANNDHVTVIEAPNEYVPYEHIVLFNPRRADFPIGDPDAAKAQITWEYRHLSCADTIIFWFAKGSLNPIVLYEYGKYGFSHLLPHVIVGVDPEYPRKQDVEIQTALETPERNICTSLGQMAFNLCKVYSPGVDSRSIIDYADRELI